MNRTSLRILPVEPGKRRRGAVAMMPRKQTPPPAVLPWLSPYWDVSPLSAKGREILDRAVDRLWQVAQTARREEQAQDFTISLGILGAIRQGWSMPVLVAYYYAFGVHPFRFNQYRLQCRTLRALELLKAAQQLQTRKPRKGAVIIEFPRIPPVARPGMRAEPRVICSQCPATAATGKTLCRVHLIKNRERVARWNEKRRATAEKTAKLAGHGGAESKESASAGTLRTAKAFVRTTWPSRQNGCGNEAS